ncbi:hypothetical protein [Moraxella catarrhalis]|uniref:hypothetical protein n=1 Tax=Moraxella catarrhalis TaxID=480 RepID=UPI001600A48C|nr:hypothetical protein [Moraxella catarrhalis]
MNLTLGGKHFAKISNSFFGFDLLLVILCFGGISHFTPPFGHSLETKKAHIKAGFGRKRKIRALRGWQAVSCADNR